MPELNWRKPLIYALLYATGNRIPKNLEYIRDYVNKPINQQKSLQLEKLKSILKYSWKNIPYYRQILTKASVVNKSGRVNLNNFNKIPPLTKAIIREQGNSLYSPYHKIRRSYKNTTSGSTGDPVEFIQDKFYSEWNFANKIYLKEIAGQQVGDRELRLWGSEEDLLGVKENLYLRLIAWLYNRVDFNSFSMAKPRQKRLVKMWRKFKPQWVEAYVQSIEEFAKYVEKSDIPLPPPRGILTTAGNLLPATEKLISRVFGCPVYNRYGTREVGDAACTKPSGHELSLSTWNHFVEILDEELEPCSSNKPGTLYITTLNNYSMPLIRYNIGDLGTSSKKWGYLASVQGRQTSFFINHKGEKIFSGFFRHILFYMSWIIKYQVIQESLTLIIYKIVTEKNITPPAADLRQIKQKIKKIMGRQCRVRFRFTNHIPTSASGKYLFTISKVNQEK